MLAQTFYLLQTAANNWIVSIIRSWASHHSLFYLLLSHIVKEAIRQLRLNIAFTCHLPVIADFVDTEQTVNEYWQEGFFFLYSSFSFFLFPHNSIKHNFMNKIHMCMSSSSVSLSALWLKAVTVSHKRSRLIDLSAVKQKVSGNYRRPVNPLCSHRSSG